LAAVSPAAETFTFEVAGIGSPAGHTVT